MIYIKTTKQVLAESMIQLLEMGHVVERVSVEDIVHNCQLSRRTFYNHFVDKQDLIGWIFEHEDQIFENASWEKQSDFAKVLLNQLNLIKVHSLFYVRALIGPAGKTLFYKEIRRRLMLWLKYTDDESMKTLFIIDFFSHGYAEAVAAWIESDTPKSPFVFMQSLRDYIPDIVFNRLRKKQ